MSPEALVAAPAFGRADGAAVDWAVSRDPVGYLEAVAAMEARAGDISEGLRPELVWLLQHPALYTAGVSARAADLLIPEFLPVFRSGRGGQFTYHGPGQRVAYVMLDLKARRRDARRFVAALERWIIDALAMLGVKAAARPGRVGVWVEKGGPESGGGEAKIAAIGVRLRRWVSFHGASLNVAPDLTHFAGIVPCGLAGFGVTSLADLGARADMEQTDVALRRTFERTFGPTLDATAPLDP
jgi:lipoyl(octanoyl) transferase